MPPAMQVHHSHNNLERRLSLVETHQKEMHELLSGMEHEAERLYNVSVTSDWAPWGDEVHATAMPGSVQLGAKLSALGLHMHAAQALPYTLQLGSQPGLQLDGPISPCSLF